MPHWAVELHAKPAADDVWMWMAELLPQYDLSMLEQPVTSLLGSEAPVVVDIIDEKPLMERPQPRPLTGVEGGA
jgi:hypothetical protein